MAADGQNASASHPGSAILGIFAKGWQPGQVKTRLAAAIGHQQAADLQRLFVQTTLRRMARLPLPDCQRWIAVTPLESLPRFRELAEVRDGGWNVVAQSDGNLGVRMENFFHEALADCPRVVLLGSDSPDVPLSWIEEAFLQLDRVPVVLGPSADGGYYLVGVSRLLLEPRPLSIVFAEIPWSTPEVLTTTLRRLDQGGIDCHLLRPWGDVDEWDDLAEFHRRLYRGEQLDETELDDLRREVGRLVHSTSSPSMTNPSHA